jgi:hypothetical protein
MPQSSAIEPDSFELYHRLYNSLMLKDDELLTAIKSRDKDAVIVALLKYLSAKESSQILSHLSGGACEKSEIYTS